MLLLRAFLAAAVLTALAPAEQPAFMNESIPRLEKELVARYGEAQRPRLQRGLKQVCDVWRSEDGDATVFESFVRDNFAAAPAALETLSGRWEKLAEQLDGHMLEIRIH